MEKRTGGIMKIKTKELRRIIQESIKKHLTLLNKEKKGRVNHVGLSIPIKMYNIDELLQHCIDHTEMLDESLIMTYDIDKVVKIMERKFGLHPSRVIENNGVISIFLPFGVSKNEIGDIKNFMNYCGYYNVKDEPVVNQAINSYVFNFIRKYPNEDITEEIFNNVEYLYHATPSLYVERIMKYGLVPKAKNKLFQYPDRIYLSTVCDDNLFKSLKVVNSINKNTGTTYSVLRISVNSLPDNIVFYKDSDYVNGVFTYDNISPDAIEIYKEDIDL